MAQTEPFKPALIVVDFQEDFCPPNGSLAVPHGRTLTPTINSLLSLPFPLRLATRDWHPPNHISFAANHANSPSSVTITHPDDASRSLVTALWPVHCVQGTPGAALVPELHVARLHRVVDKGMDARVEMYSAFRDPFGVCDSGLAAMMRDEGVTHVYVVGLAADYCVRATAEHAVEEGWPTYIVEEGTRPVHPDKWQECKQEIEDKGVKMISAEGDEVARVRSLA